MVAINIEPSQDAYGVELFTSHGYTFTPLQMPDPNWADRYDVHEAPTNFLLDRAGRLVFRPRFGTEEERRISIATIERLLRRPLP